MPIISIMNCVLIEERGVFNENITYFSVCVKVCEYSMLFLKA